MALTKEDLQAIKSIVDESVKAGVSGLEGRMEGLEGRMDSLEGRMDGLEGRMDCLEGRMEGLEEHVNALDEHMNALDGHVNALDVHMDVIENEIKCIKVDILENDVIKRLSQMEACYLEASNRYIWYSDLFKEKINLIDSIDQTVTNHSKQIQELQTKMA